MTTEVYIDEQSSLSLGPLHTLIFNPIPLYPPFRVNFFKFVSLLQENNAECILTPTGEDEGCFLGEVPVLISEAGFLLLIL